MHSVLLPKFSGMDFHSRCFDGALQGWLLSALRPLGSLVGRLVWPRVMRTARSWSHAETYLLCIWYLDWEDSQAELSWGCPFACLPIGYFPRLRLAHTSKQAAWNSKAPKRAVLFPAALLVQQPKFP